MRTGGLLAAWATAKTLRQFKCACGLFQDLNLSSKIFTSGNSLAVSAT
jgi:hypothetical protein